MPGAARFRTHDNRDSFSLDASKIKIRAEAIRLKGEAFKAALGEEKGRNSINIKRP